MKIKYKYFIHRAVEHLCFPLRFLPVKNNRIVFSSYGTRSQYVDSPMYITEKLMRDKKYQIIWAVNDTGRFAFLSEKNIQAVRYRSFRDIYYSNTAKVLVTNLFSFPPYVRPKKGQLRINTMHGGGAYKSLLSSQSDMEHTNRYDYLFINHRINKCNLCLSASRLTSELVFRRELGYTGRILDSGLPRNDIFFHIDPNTVTEVKRQFGVRDKCVLMMPTWRRDNSRKSFDIHYHRLTECLHRQYGGEWKVLLRTHHHSRVDISDLLKRYGDVVCDAGDYGNPQDLICAADLLITDYSSAIWDFAVKGGPVILYAPDMNEYKRERGFVLPPEQWNLCIAEEEEKLFSIIQTHTLEELSAASKKHLESYGSYETGNATDTVCRYIADYVKTDAVRERTEFL